ncbi:VOC family protein [Actinacidiphila glaucinigra]|uniref:VOC family protein n=1 Tax=Actinacidiphila glaucinigra TaxID=235986 RepID=UPI003D8C0FFB
MAAYPDGTPCWADAMLNDLEAGKRFYGGLLGWTFGAGEEQYGQYTQAYGPDGKNVAALSPKPDGRMPTVWNLYLASSDIRATADRIRDSGGQLIMQPMAVGAFGTMLMAADPGGAVFGVWQPGTHGGFEATGVPGSYIWAEIYTRETERTDPFYEDVFGFGSKRIEDEAIDFRIFVPEGQEVTPGNAVLGRFRMGEGFPEELPAHIIVYFAVSDADRAAETVARLGGRVTMGPMDSPFGRFLLASDDQGAHFALIDPGTTVGEKPS